MLGIGLSQLDGKLEFPHKEQSTAVLRLDTFCAGDVPFPDLLKVDVEGGELDIVRGARSLIEAHHPIWYMEVAHNHTKRYGYKPDDLFSFMQSYGYRAYTMALDGTLQLVESYKPPGDDYFFKV